MENRHLKDLCLTSLGGFINADFIILLPIPGEAKAKAMPGWLYDYNFVEHKVILLSVGHQYSLYEGNINTHPAHWKIMMTLIQPIGRS